MPEKVGLQSILCLKEFIKLKSNPSVEYFLDFYLFIFLKTMFRYQTCLCIHKKSVVYIGYLSFSKVHYILQDPWV